ncbi:MAG TPA: putative glycoside hydrolase, partial [Terriglobales bacterium]|nr:putative glycoside hydrolase [Terriglobales bacterium]
MISAAQSAQPQLVQASRPSIAVSSTSNSPTPAVAPPGTTLYVAKRGDSIPLVARHYLSQTSYLTSTELAQAIRNTNADVHGTFLKPGQQVIIPGILDAPVVEKSVPVARDFEVRAVYLTGVMAASDRGMRIIRRWREVGGNAVVFDIKDSDGAVNIPFEHPLVGSHHSAIRDLPKFVRFVHSQNMHAIARMAIFRDERLVTTHPELAVKSRKSGQAWRENGKLVWTDPSQPKVQEFDIALAKKAAESGADEIQFDYVRFPAEGDQKDASFVFQTANPEWHRTDVIADFLKHAYA